MFTEKNVHKSELLHKIEMYLIGEFKKSPLSDRFPDTMLILLGKYIHIANLLVEFTWLDSQIINKMVDIINYTRVSSSDSDPEPELPKESSSRKSPFIL